MNANPYASPVHDAPVLGRWLSLLCMALATYCGLFFVNAAVVARVTAQPVSVSVVVLSALGVVAWTVAGMSIRYGYGRTACSIGVLAVVAQALLVV